MPNSTVERFQTSLSTVDASVTTATPDEFEEALAEAVTAPAVGAPLPFDDVSLSDTPVTLDASPSEVRNAVTGVIGSRMGIASLGTVAIESRTEGDELISLYPENHVVVIRSSDVTTDLEDGFDWLETEFDRGNRSFVLATGPSATGDMGALVQGVHGPETEHVIIVKDNE